MDRTHLICKRRSPCALSCARSSRCQQQARPRSHSLSVSSVAPSVRKAVQLHARSRHAFSSLVRDPVPRISYVPPVLVHRNSTSSDSAPVSTRRARWKERQTRWNRQRGWTMRELLREGWGLNWDQRWRWSWHWYWGRQRWG
ncbi:hypothetical protein K438DRAFT_886828 [Mycena galopus ATCC 62051]|nr:hypothetical protein K438DRAFT_886828 [Mycena galopus ATCC 62051]